MQRAACRSLLLGSVLLSGCVNDIYQMPGSRQTPWPAPRTVPAPPSVPEPSRPVITPVPPRPQTPVQPDANTHPRYAPPPHVPAHWDNALGVYVVSGQSLYYRERLYYRWEGDWHCSASPSGPWEPVAEISVPMGLRVLH